MGPSIKQVNNKFDRDTKFLKELQSRINENPNLGKFSPFFTDAFILSFIHGKHYDCDKAFKTLKNFMQVRTEKHSELFRSLRPSLTTPCLSRGKVKILKNRDNLNRLVVVDQYRLWDPIIDSVDTIFKALILIFEDILIQNLAPEGIVVIFDAVKFHFQHAKHLTPTVILQALNMYVNSMPLKYKALHIVNPHYLVTLLVKTVKPFIPKKIRERIYTHEHDLASLYEHIPRTILPESLGGDLPDAEAFDTEINSRIRSRENYYSEFAVLL